MTAHGLEAEVRELLAAEARQGGTEQLGLEFDDMPSPVQQLAETKGVALRGPGRPPGSRSRAVADVVEFIKRTKRPTLLVLKEWADLPLDEFKRLTGISDADKAFARWLQIAELCAAYEIGRPTQRLELPPGQVLPVVVMAEAPVDPRYANGNPPTEAEFEVIQDLSGSARSQVAQPKSHDDSQDAEFIEEPPL